MTLAPAALLGGEGVAPDPAALGGATTRAMTNRNAFSLRASNLPRAGVLTFFAGNLLFNASFTFPGTGAGDTDGLGPTFNGASCAGCHLRDGRGQPPSAPAAPMTSMLVRLSVPGTGADGGPNPHPAYGRQLNILAMPGVPAEGRVAVQYVEIEGRYGDGEPFSLRKPVYALLDGAHGPFGEDVMISPRVAPHLIGLGLLEAVPAASLLARADPEDMNGDGISGRPNMVWDTAAGAPRLGRFGWKANQPSLRQQVASAFLGDMGITTPLYPAEDCPTPQVACAAVARDGRPELDREGLDAMELYVQTLAVPARRNIGDPLARRGATLFLDAGCAACHTPAFLTGAHPIAALAGQSIQPFTDLLLHDMGPGLADGRPDFDASGREWRTPPLWGIGLIETVSQHDFLLHDGRARGMAEAILWHGGEAEGARERFRAMPEVDREALIAFLDSL
jgi:CxxC motif-containing protein (DUF1111 family)